MAIRLSCSLTPYHKKESITYLIRKLNRYARNLGGEPMALAVETIANQIATDTYTAYRNANYDGAIDVRRVGKSNLGAYNTFGNSRVENVSNKTVLVSSHPLGKEITQRGTGVVLFQEWAVEVSGQLGSFLEFGTGDKFRGSGYSSRFISHYYQKPTSRHFISPENGLDTWVYKGERGSNPATRHNEVHKRNGEVREGYYYSQGNYPTRGLYNAVRKFKRSPMNVRQIVKTAYYKGLKLY